MSRKLSVRQAELLERVCLKRYHVTFTPYMGSVRPHERVDIHDQQGGWDYSFRPSTLHSLRDKDLARLVHHPFSATSEIKPTAAGLAMYRGSRDLTRPRPEDMGESDGLGR